ncbi:uncharacterized protein LOC127737928 [Mytilus californianus]|uniref:uncharacterized protein LOC127737928 n=1 Tax=Mytilus californianus TaxID=6549 RepID=UPI002245F749|nr:uncharacterized protein LOC127737928 [Mytilus californianus]
MKITKLNDILLQCATLVLILAFLKVKILSAQRQFRVFRIEANPHLQRHEPFNLMPSGQENVLHFDGGSFRVEGAVPREISQGQSDSGRSFQSNRAHESQGLGFNRQVSLPLDPFGQFMADVLPDHMRRKVRLEKIANTDNSPSGVLPDHLRSTSNNENKQSSHKKENHRQPQAISDQHNVYNQNEPSKKAHDHKEPMNENIGMFDMLMDPQQSRINDGIHSPFDTFHPTPSPVAFNPDGYFPGLFPFSGDGEFEPFLMQSHPRSIDLRMENPQQNSQQSHTPLGNNPTGNGEKLPSHKSNRIPDVPEQGIMTTKNQKKSSIDSQLINQQDQSKHTAFIMDAMLQNRRFMDAMNEIRHISRFSKPLLRQSNQKQFVTKTSSNNNSKQQESKVIDSKTIFPQTQTEKQSKEIGNKKSNNTKPKKKVVQLSKSPKHLIESIRKQVINVGDPRAPKVVEIQIESDRPELTKNLLMNLLTDPNVQVINGPSQNIVKSSGNKQSSKTSLLSLLSGQQQPHQQFSAGIPSSYYTKEIITPQFTKTIAKPRFRAGIPISHFPDKQFIKTVKKHSRLFEENHNVKTMIPNSLKQKDQFSPKQKIDKIKAKVDNTQSDMRMISPKRIVNKIKNHKQRKQKVEIELPKIFVPFDKTMNANNREVYVSAIPSFSMYQGNRKLPVRQTQNVPQNKIVFEGNYREKAYVQPAGSMTISPVKTVKEQFDSGIPKINHIAVSEALVKIPLNKVQPGVHVPILNENIGQNVKSKVDKMTKKKNIIGKEAALKTIASASEVVSINQKDKSSNAEVSNKEFVSSSILTTDAKTGKKLKENVTIEKNEKKKESSSKKEDSKSKKKSKRRKSKKSRSKKKKSRKSKNKSKKRSDKSKQGTDKL